MRLRFESTRRLWRSLALIFLNTCLLLTVVNVGLFALFKIRDDRRVQPHQVSRSPETLSRHGVVHPGLDREQIRALWEETYLASSGFVYEPYTQFRVAAFDGRYVSIDERGFRRHEGVGPWPPDPEAVNVFLYGGSTTFGYGVSDEQTIATHLQRYLGQNRASGDPGRPVHVYNFGRSGYFSAQERLLFESHLLDGVAPDIAVFIDGLNDCRIVDNVPIFTARLRKHFNVREVAFTSVLARLPMMRLARAVARRVRGVAAPRPAPVEEASARMAQRYLANRRVIQAVSASHGVGAFFVWQPTSFYNYDRAHHLFADSAEPPHVRAGYTRMAGIAAKGRLGENFLWLADMQIGMAEPLYVDQAHYGGPMSRRVAVEIGDWLVERGALGGDPGVVQ